MSDEMTYEMLMLQDSVRVRSNQDGNNLRKEGHPAQSFIWRGAALSLMTLCLLLVTGLVTLGIMFLQMSNDIKSDSKKLSQLQKIIHPQQDNLSEVLNISQKDPTEESLQSQISALLERQRQMATKLCKEFLIHTSGFPSGTAITHTLFLLAGIVLELNRQTLAMGRWFISLSNPILAIFLGLFLFKYVSPGVLSPWLAIFDLAIRNVPGSMDPEDVLILKEGMFTFLAVVLKFLGFVRRQLP